MTDKELIQLYKLLVKFRDIEKPGILLKRDVNGVIFAIEVHPVYAKASRV